MVPKHGTMKRRDSGASIVWRVVAILASLVLVGSLVALGVMAYSYWQGRQQYDGLAEMYVKDSTGENGAQERVIDWKALTEINPDIVGWVTVPNTPIDYPIVQAGDNQYYLNRDFSGEEAWLAQFGCIFLEYTNDPTFADDASFIYGHHMNDGSMFASIGSMRSQEDFEQRRNVILYTPEKTYKLRGFAVIHCPGTENIVTTNFNTPEDRASYIDEMIQRSEFDPGKIPDVKSMENIIALATCDDSVGTTGRYVMFCYIDE